MESSSDSFNEIIITEISYDRTKIIMMLCYRPPNSSIDFNNNFYECLCNLKSAGYRNLCIMGDFNIPNVNWDSLTSTDLLQQNLCDIFDQFDLSQINLNPSRKQNLNILCKIGYLYFYYN